MSYQQETTDRASVGYALKRYVDMSVQIRELSAPQLDGIKNAEDYRVRLLDNFTQIGVYGMKNNEILANTYFPMIGARRKLNDEERESLWELSDMLLRSYSIDYLDLPMYYTQSTRLLKDAEQKDDVGELLRALDGMVNAASVMMYMTQRLYPSCDVCFHYRDAGLAAAKRILHYLEPSLFSSLPDESAKHLVLRNARYICSLFDRRDRASDYETNETDLAYIRRSLTLADAPFYRTQVPSFDWEYHIFRTYHNAMILTERANVNGYTPSQLAEFHDYAIRMRDLWNATDNEELKILATEKTLRLYECRSAYLAGRMEKDDYRRALRDLISSRDVTDFSTSSVLLNMLAPLEYILSLQGERLTQEEEQFLATYYEDLVGYVYHIPKRGSFSLMLTFLTDILRNYITVQDGMRFEDICLKLMAALHPPTYVHSLSVASFSTFLTSHLIRLRPELFVGVCDCASPDEVLKKKQEIVRLMRHSALLHDVGKLFVIETILTYGRPLFDMEKELIQTHPATGAHLLSLHPHTAPYADAALWHHLWHDNQGGYPVTSKERPPQNRILIDILACADCLDAATDQVGRSYKPGKEPEDFIAELRAQSGERYAPCVVALLEDENIRRDVRTLLAVGRNENYRDAYRILKSL